MSKSFIMVKTLSREILKTQGKFYADMWREKHPDDVSLSSCMFCEIDIIRNFLFNHVI